MSLASLSIHSSHSGQTELTVDALAQHERSQADIMAARYNAANTASAVQTNNLIRSLLAEQKRQSIRQKKQDAVVKALTKERRKDRPDHIEGACGVEPWVKKAMLEDDLRQTHNWWYVEKNRWENKHESLLRNRIYHHLISQIPPELYSQIENGDVRSVYYNIATMGARESAEQVLSLERELLTMTKHGKPMANWLDMLYTVFKQPSILGQPRTVAQIRLLIFENLSDDKRYNDVVRDLKRNSHWSMVQIRTALEAQATECGDLLVSPVHNPDNREQREIVRAAKKKQVREATSSDSDESEEEPTTRKKRSRKAAAAKRKAAAAKAHPPTREARPAPAEGQRCSQTEIAKSGEEACRDFALGRCKYGDSCHYSHDPVPAAKPDAPSNQAQDKAK